MSWDNYFREVAEAVAKNSKCLSRKVGAVLVRDKNIVSTGYNGPPRNVLHCGERIGIDLNLHRGLDLNPDICPRQKMGFKSGEGLEYCIAGHAERNALIYAARYGIATEGTTLYLTCAVPCTPCLVEIINAGVKEVVVTEMKFYDGESPFLIKYGNLIVREYKKE